MLEGRVEEVKIYNAENPLNTQERYWVDQDSVFKMRAQSYHRYLATLKDDNHLTWQEILQTLKTFKPNLVGISVLTVEVGSALKVSKICKEYNKDCLIVWGGPHPTFEPDESIRYKEVDFLIRGEGEMTIKELIDALQTGGKELGTIKGLSYKAEGEVIHTGPRDLIKDLDTIPLPAKHLSLYPEQYLPIAMGSLITSRGCPWSCTFCSAKTFWQKKTRYRSAESLVQEIKKIQTDYHIQEFLLWDDAFTVSREIVSRYCQKMIQEGLKLYWRTATRADLLDDKLLKLMKKAGCVHLDIGVESGSKRILKLIRKELEPAQIRKGFDLIRKNGMTAGAFFMAGFPQETQEDLEKTFSLMKEIKAVNIAFNILDPLPGSEILKTTREMGIIPEEVDWSTFPFWPLNHFVKEVSKEEFCKLAHEMEAWVHRYNKRWRNLIRRAKPLLWYRFRKKLSQILRRYSY
jgi:radical SAM superfamily enzyme YgiQ (UPF0313 family)